MPRALPEVDDGRLGGAKAVAIVFTCDDINRTFEELSGRGVHFSQPPQPMAWGPFAIFDDVDGNWYGLRQDAP